MVLCQPGRDREGESLFMELFCFFCDVHYMKRVCHSSARDLRILKAGECKDEVSCPGYFAVSVIWEIKEKIKLLVIYTGHIFYGIIRQSYLVHVPISLPVFVFEKISFLTVPGKVLEVLCKT